MTQPLFTFKGQNNENIHLYYASFGQWRLNSELRRCLCTGRRNWRDSSLLASRSQGKWVSSAFRIFLRLCAVTCRADGGSRCGEAAGCSASVFGAPPSLRTPRPAQRPLTPDPALPESGGIRRPACPGKIWRPPRALIYGKRASTDYSDRAGFIPQARCTPRSGLCAVIARFVALCCALRLKTRGLGLAAGPRALRRPHSGLIHWGWVIVYKCPCMHAQARNTKRPFVLKQRARARIYACVGINSVVYYGSKWRAQSGFVFSGRGKIMVTTRRHVYVRFQVLKYEETFIAFIRARGVESFGARCYTHSLQMHEASSVSSRALSF